MKLNISEKKLNSIINESIKRVLNENDIMTYEPSGDLREVPLIEVRKYIWSLCGRNGEGIGAKIVGNENGNIKYEITCKKDDEGNVAGDVDSLIETLRQHEENGELAIDFVGDYYDLHPEEKNSDDLKKNSKFSWFVDPNDKWIANVTIYRNSDISESKHKKGKKKLNEITTGFYMWPEEKKIEYLKDVYKAEWENACDDLYYGYGYDFWRKNNNSIEDDNVAKLLWKAAVERMGNDF